MRQSPAWYPYGLTQSDRPIPPRRSALRLAGALTSVLTVSGCIARERGPEASEHMAIRKEAVLETGDFIVYRYEGTQLPIPVILKERVTARTGRRLTIEVEARRAKDSLRWIQVVTDTPENRANNVVDELYEVVDGHRVRLANEGNRDLLRLYAWVQPPHAEPWTPSLTLQRAVSLPHGVTVQAECLRHFARIGDRFAAAEHCRSPDFAWWHIKLSYTDITNGEVLFAVRVTDMGHQAPD